MYLFFKLLTHRLREMQRRAVAAAAFIFDFSNFTIAVILRVGACVSA